MNDVTVCVPWRPTSDRIAAHRRFREYWAHHGIPVVEADSTPGKPFHRAQARNKAVRKAKTEHIIVSDADTIGDIAPILAALDLDGVTYPHNAFRHIPNEYADHPDLMTAPVDRPYPNSCGGLYVTTRQTYWEVGGNDERFTHSWGFEDSAFYQAARTLTHLHRLPGIIFSFNHAVPGGRDLTQSNPNYARFLIYKACAGNGNMMKELIKR
jgi:hypothetical protein